MTTVSRCPQSDLPVAFCAHCRPRSKPRPRLFAITSPRWVEARYPGQRAGCGEPYASSSLIQKDAETGGWRPECCPEDGGE